MIEARSSSLMVALDATNSPASQTCGRAPSCFCCKCSVRHPQPRTSPTSARPNPHLTRSDCPFPTFHNGLNREARFCAPRTIAAAGAAGPYIRSGEGPRRPRAPLCNRRPARFAPCRCRGADGCGSSIEVNAKKVAPAPPPGRPRRPPRRLRRAGRRFAHRARHRRTREQQVAAPPARRRPPPPRRPRPPRPRRRRSTTTRRKSRWTSGCRRAADAAATSGRVGGDDEDGDQGEALVVGRQGDRRAARHQPEERRDEDDAQGGDRQVPPVRHDDRGAGNVA